MLDYRTSRAGCRRGYFPGGDASRLGVAMVALPKDRVIEIVVNIIAVMTSLDTLSGGISDGRLSALYRPDQRIRASSPAANLA